MASNIIEQENLAEIGDFSLYLISNDKVNIGLGILSSTLTALFGFLAGIGVAKSNI